MQVDPRLLKAKQKLEEVLDIADALRRDGINLQLHYGEHNYVDLAKNAATLVAVVRP